MITIFALLTVAMLKLVSVFTLHWFATMKTNAQLTSAIKRLVNVLTKRKLAMTKRFAPPTLVIQRVEIVFLRH
jgi:uncharacterized protein YggT (Ycf19 family)